MSTSKPTGVGPQSSKPAAGTPSAKSARTGRPVRPAPKRRSAAWIVLPLVVVAAGAGGAGWWLFYHNADPLKRAEQLAAKRDYRGALIEARNAVRSQPNNARAHLLLGETQLRLADPVAAEKELKSAQTLGADKATVTTELGRAYLALGRFADVLSTVPAEGPNSAATGQNLMLRSMAQVNLKDLPAASASMQAAEKAEPDNKDVLLASARLAMIGKDWALAKVKADAVLKLDPNELDGLLINSQVLDRTGDKAGALAMLDKAVASHPDAFAARLDRANQLIIGGQDAKATEDVDAVLKAQPKNAGATYLKGVLLVRGGKFADAQTELQKLMPMAQRFPRALYFEALATLNLGQTEVAIDYAERYVNLRPDDADGVRLLARAELEAKRPELAVTSLERAVSGGLKDGATLDLLGRAYAMQGVNDKAVEAFKQAIALSPNDPAILTHLASVQMKDGNPVQAASALEKSLKLSPNQPHASEALVAAALSAGNMPAAESALAALRHEQGDSEMVGVMTGMVALGKLDLDAARVAFEATVKRFPDSVEAKLNLAKVLVLQGRKPEGEALLQEILAKQPANLPVLNTLVQLLAQQKTFPPAIAAVQAARKADPKNAGFTALLSDLMVASGDAKGAIGLLQDARGGGTLAPPLQMAMARAQAAAGQEAEAEQTYADLLKAQPNDLMARQGQVDLLLRDNKTDAAKASLREALAASPGNLLLMTSMVQLEARTTGADAGLKLADALRNDTANLPNSTLLRGDELMREKRYADAEQAFTTEYKLTPTAGLALRVSNSLIAQNKDGEALKGLVKWQANDPQNPDIALMISLIDIKVKKLDDAEKQLTLVLSKRPADAVALNNMAWLYQKKGEPKLARNMAQRAYLLRPTPETADTLGWIMVQTGDATTGVPLLQKASGQQPDNPSILYHLAVGLNAEGKPDEAVKVLQPIVSAAPNFDDKEAARTLLSKLTPNK